MEKTYKIQKAEMALDIIIDQARTQGSDLWAIEQQKRTFLATIQELIVQEVAQVSAATSCNSQAQNPNLAYEKIERRYDTGSFQNFVNNISIIPKTLFFGIIGVLAFFQLLHIIFPRVL